MSGRLWLTLLALAFAGTILFLTFPTTLRIVDRIDAWLLKGLAHIRTPWLTSTMRGIASAGSGWTITVLGLGTVAALMVFRRWRHVLVFLGAAFLMASIGRGTYLLLTRPRPYDVRIIGWWSGFSMPSPPVTVLATI